MQSQCELYLDVDQDGIIGANDLLGLLAVFGNSDLDFDCVWDHMDPCVNGDGNCELEPNGPCEGMSFIHYHGVDYPLVAVGDDCWFAQNLRTETYANGDSVLDPEEYVSLFGTGQLISGPTFPAYEGYLKTFSDEYTQRFGYLYANIAAFDERGLCPAGWHVPLEDDWIDAELNLGLPDSLAYMNGVRGTHARFFKSASFWPSINALGQYVGGIGGYLDILPAGFTGGPLGTGNVGWMSIQISSSMSESRFLDDLAANGGNGDWEFHPTGYTYYHEVGCDTCYGLNQQIFSREFYGYYNLSEQVNRSDSYAPHYSGSARCVKNQAGYGQPCDDGLDFTYNDVWPTDGTGTCIGTLAVDLSGTGPCEGAMFLDYSENRYSLIELDGRCWFRENLRTRYFSNGDSIPFHLEWGNNNGSAMTMSTSEDALHPEEYFYNKHAAQDLRGVCPSGWSVPSSAEWNSLISAFGGHDEFVVHNLQGPGWDFSGVPDEFDNSGGLSVLQTGHIFPQSNCHHIYHGGFWQRNAWTPIGFPFAVLGMDDPNTGLSIRCLKNL
jgi:uncharacterized protein (TIGR02145 family)